MRKSGTIVSWKTDKGFGFIAPTNGGKEVFVHIKAFGKGSQPPAIGAEVSYEEAVDAQGRARAEYVEATHGSYTPGPAAKALGLTTLFFALLAGMAASGKLPMPLLYWYLAISILTFIAYAMDKSAARHGDWRIAEKTLHLFSLLGGWPGALCAQQLLRHKSSKQSFRFIYWLTVILNIAVLGYLISGHGSEALASMKSLISQARALNIHILS